MVVKVNDVVLISDEIRDYFLGDDIGLVSFTYGIDTPQFTGQQMLGVVVGVKPSSPESDILTDENSIATVQINELGITTNINSLWLKVIK